MRCMECRWGRLTAAATGGRILASLAALALVATGCGGAEEPPTENGGRPDQLVTVRTEQFTSQVDDSTVTGLAAIPRAVSSRGCVIWQFGFRSTKENADYAWQGLAALGLTTFSIDFRYHGARATSKEEYRQVLEDPQKFDAMVRESVGDLKSAADFLEQQPYCDGHIAYAGVSLGGAIGTIFAAEDERVEAVILAVTPGGWRQVITAPESPLPRSIVDDPDQLEIYRKLDPDRYVGEIAPRPILILSGKSDQTVLLKNAQKLQEAAGDPKRIFEFDGGHNPVVGPDAEKIGNEVGSFLLRTMVQPSYGVEDTKPNATFYERAGS